MTLTLPEHELTRRSTTAALLCLLLVPVWIPFDWVLDPQHFLAFLALRLACMGTIAVGLVLYLRSRDRKKHYRRFSLLTYLALVGAILPMCLMTDEKYPYYMGLSAVFYGASVLMIWPLRYFMIPMGVCVGLIVALESHLVTDLRSGLIGTYLLLNVVLTSTLASWLTFKSHQSNQSLLDTLDHLSNVDGLTGLYNRRYFDQRLALEVNRSARHASNIALLFLDIDHFKRYNDRLGHPQGDQCLRQVGVCLNTAITRKSDFVARYGGEEFVVVLPDSDMAGAKVVAQRIMSGLWRLDIPHPDSPVAPQVTVSIGIAAGNSASARNLLTQADQALYQAKQQGRNRWVEA